MGPGRAQCRGESRRIGEKMTPRVHVIGAVDDAVAAIASARVAWFRCSRAAEPGSKFWKHGPRSGLWSRHRSAQKGWEHMTANNW